MERTLRRAFELSGYYVVSAGTAADARVLLPQVRPDLIIMDLVLPDADGLMLTLAFHSLTDAPIVICSGRDRQVDRVLGLKLGASTFIAKPVDLDELQARVEAIVRRTTRPSPQVSKTTGIHVGDLVIAPTHASVTISDKPVHLTPTEFRLLVILASDPDRIFSRESLIEQVWGYSDLNARHLVDVHMGRLRMKLRLVSPDEPYVITVRGHGYRLKSSD